MQAGDGWGLLGYLSPLVSGSEATSCPEQPPLRSPRRGQCPHPFWERLSGCSNSDVPVPGNSVLARTVVGALGWELGGHWLWPWGPCLLGPGAVSPASLTKDTGWGQAFPEVRRVWAGWGDEILRCLCLGEPAGSRPQAVEAWAQGPGVPCITRRGLSSGIPAGRTPRQPPRPSGHTPTTRGPERPQSLLQFWGSLGKAPLLHGA